MGPLPRPACLTIGSANPFESSLHPARNFESLVLPPSTSGVFVSIRQTEEIRGQCQRLLAFKCFIQLIAMRLYLACGRACHDTSRLNGLSKFVPVFTVLFFSAISQNPAA